MSQAVDVNVLVYASNVDAPENERAVALVHHLAAGPDLLVLFWPALDPACNPQEAPMSSKAIGEKRRSDPATGTYP